MARATAARARLARRFALGAALTWFAALPAQAAPKFAAGTLAELRARAATAKQPLVVDFSTEACAPCRRLLRETWSDAGLWAAVGDSALVARIDPEQDPGAAAFELAAYPTIVVLGPDGSELGRVVGFCTAAQLQPQLEKLVAPDSARPQQRMQLGDERQAAGDPAGALQHYLWCWDHGLENDKAFTGVRASFLRSKLRDLARDYAPARAAVEQRRDALEQRIVAGEVTFELVSDMVCLNEALDAQERSLAVHDRLPAEAWRGQEVARGVLARSVVPLLVERRRYADALRLHGDPQRRLDNELQMLQLMPRDSEPRRAMVRVLLKQQSPVLEALFGTNQDQAAADLFARLLELQPGIDTWMMALRGSQHAGRDVVCHDYAVRAMQELPEADHAAVRAFLAGGKKK